MLDYVKMKFLFQTTHQWYRKTKCGIAETYYQTYIKHITIERKHKLLKNRKRKYKNCEQAYKKCSKSPVMDVHKKNHIFKTPNTHKCAYSQKLKEKLVR